MGYDIDDFVNQIADCSYSRGSTFWSIPSYKANNAYFGHAQADFEMMASYRKVRYAIKIYISIIYKYYPVR